MAGTRIVVKAVPKARLNKVVEEEGGLKIYTTAAPENGKANAAVLKLLAKHLGVAKSKLKLIRGETARSKIFELD